MRRQTRWQTKWKRYLRDLRRKREKARRRKEENARDSFMRAQEGMLGDSFRLEFHFDRRKETDLDKINGVLARLELSGLEIEKYRGYLATETKVSAQGEEQGTRRWYGLDECVLRCTYAKPEDSERYQISTMVMDKTIADGEAHWREANPGRVLREFILIECDSCYAAIAAHHDRPGIEAPGQTDNGAE